MQRREAAAHEREDGLLRVRARFGGLDEVRLEFGPQRVLEGRGRDDEVLCLAWAWDALGWWCWCACRWWKWLEVGGVVSVGPVRC